MPDSYLLHAFVIENAYQSAASREPKMGRYISEFQHSLQGIYTRTDRIIYPVAYLQRSQWSLKVIGSGIFDSTCTCHVKTYSFWLLTGLK